MSAANARSEFADWDPLAPEAAARPLIDEFEQVKTPKRVWPRKYKRSPYRDISAELQSYIAAHAQQLATIVMDAYAEKEVWELSHEDEIQLANDLNLKTQHVAECWRGDKTEDRDVLATTTAERSRACASELGALRRLEPLRHLIAIAHDPEAAEDGEINQAVEKLGAMVPADLRSIINDLALVLDLVAKVKELRGPVFKQRFAYYERAVDAEPTIKTFVVNWCRNHRHVDAIYPPGVTRWKQEHESEEMELA